MPQLETPRLLLEPMSHAQFDIFVRDMLTDPRVVEHYHSYRDLFDLHQIRSLAEKDFWENFEVSRARTEFEIWSINEKPTESSEGSFVGWTGLLRSSISDQFGGPELQFMIASRAFGQGYATEASAKVLDDAQERELTPKVIATVDIPNAGSIRVLEKLEFEFIEQIESYGSSEMYLYTKQLETVSQ